MRSDVLHLMRCQGWYHWTMQIAPASSWIGDILRDRLWSCPRSRTYRAQSLYMLGRKCEQSYQLVDRFWLIFFITTNRASREGMEFYCYWWWESMSWVFLFRQESCRSNIRSELVLVKTVSAVWFTFRDCTFLWFRTLTMTGMLIISFFSFLTLWLLEGFFFLMCIKI